MIGKLFMGVVDFSVMVVNDIRGKKRKTKTKKYGCFNGSQLKCLCCCGDYLRPDEKGKVVLYKDIKKISKK